MMNHFYKKRKREPGEEKNNEKDKSGQPQQLYPKEQRHIGHVDDKSPDFDLNTEEAELISEAPESLEREIKESKEAEERMTAFEDLKDNPDKILEDNLEKKLGDETQTESLKNKETTEQVIETSRNDEEILHQQGDTANLTTKRIPLSGQVTVRETSPSLIQ